MGVFSQFLNDKMKAAGYNPNSLARALNEDAPLIHRIATGERPPSDRIIEKLALLDPLKVTIDELKEKQEADKIKRKASLRSISAAAQDLPLEEKLKILDSLPDDELEKLLIKRFGPGKLRKKGDA